MKLLNCTPHALVLRSSSGEETVLPPCGYVARVASEPGERVHYVAGWRVESPVPIYNKDIVGDVDLPPQQEGVFLIVSAVVGAAVQREDLLVPGTGPADEAVRDDRGQIVAVTRLKRVTR